MHRWKLSALATAAFATTAFISFHASALTLGALRVDSALGESLRAEIAIPQATPTELSNLVVQIATPEAFRARGLDYSAAANSIEVQLVKKPDGASVLQLRSKSPLNDPFIDLVVDTQWNTGSIQRSYTILLDPRAAAKPRTAQAAPQTPTSSKGKTYSSDQHIRVVAPSPRRVAASSTGAAATSNETVQVRAGDTAGRIANANRPAGVSIDQMLVALLHSNPKAFINGNVNLVRAGAVLQMPSREQALETSPQEARKIIATQSRDFNAYRRNLAAKAQQATVQAAARSASGQVQAQAPEIRDAAETADKLTLSKGAVQNAANEEKLAAQKQAEAQESRMSELQRNLAELNELAQSNTPTTSTTPQAVELPAAPASTPPVETAAPSAESQSTTPSIAISNTTLIEPVETGADTPPASATDAPAATAQAPSATDATPQPRVAPAPVAAQESLLDDPLLPAGAALIVLLLGVLGYSVWKRRRAAATTADQDPDLANIQSHLDTFLAENHDQHVDTNLASATSMAYAPSQLDGGADVDPVAEADVYLAYGRDVQAEEILKEALLTQPERVAIYVKLAEIYAKREDAASLVETAHTLQTLTAPNSTEWQRVKTLGQQVAPQNPLFADATTAHSSSSFASALQANTASTATDPAEPLASSVQQAPDATDITGHASFATAKDAVQDNHSDGLDLDFSGFEASLSQHASAPDAAPRDPMADQDQDHDLDPSIVEPVDHAASTPDRSLDFDLGSLNLDLGAENADTTPADNAKPMHNLANDPLATKLDLAREFNTIGDSEGARALIEEVLAEASGPLKERAQKMLSELD